MNVRSVNVSERMVCSPAAREHVHDETNLNRVAFFFLEPNVLCPRIFNVLKHETLLDQLCGQRFCVSAFATRHRRSVLSECVCIEKLSELRPRLPRT